jgi:hypothetical protein
MRGLVISDVVEEPLVAAVIDRRPNAEGTLLHCIGGHLDEA